MLIATIEEIFSDPAYFAGEWRTRSTKPYFDRFLDGLEPGEWSDAFESFALSVARDFLAGQRDFQMSDDLINEAYDEALHRVGEGYKYPALFDEVYQAFDDGEWDHRGAYSDPVSQLTIPALKAIVARTEN